MSSCYSGMFKKEVKSTRSGADFIFYNYSRLREEAGGCRLDIFGEISFGGNSFFFLVGEGGGCLNSQRHCGFLSREHTGFLGNREVQPPEFCWETKAWPGMLPTMICSQGLTVPPAQAVSWVGEVQKCQLCKIVRPGPCLSPRHWCKQLLILRSPLSRALWLSR